MSTPMPDREYLILGGLSIVALIGWVWWLLERTKDPSSGSPGQSAAPDQAGRIKRSSPPAILLTLLFVLTVGGYLYYNLTFVQHQGRYLFPALISIGLAFAMGWWQVLDQVKQLVARLFARSRRAWTPWLDEAQLILFALIFIYLARLDLVALQHYIIPNLSA
jgi:hypothetical protein